MRTMIEPAEFPEQVLTYSNVKMHPGAVFDYQGHAVVTRCELDQWHPMAPWTVYGRPLYQTKDLREAYAWDYKGRTKTPTVG